MFSFFLTESISTIGTPLEERSFVNWMRQNDILYTGDEYALRFGIFISTQRYVNEWNRAGKSCRLAVNKFAALTPAELTQLRLSKKTQRTPNQYRYDVKPTVTDIPASLDYRDKGIVNNIKDDVGCGAGWAFGTTAAIESCWALFTGKLYVLSEQNLVDCCYLCDGCNDGNPDICISQIVGDQNGYSMQEKDYPWVAQFENECNFDSSKGVAQITGAYNISPGKPDETAALLVEYGPIVAGIDSDHNSFTYYESGIYNDPDCYAWGIDWYVTIIGYGTEGQTYYWLCRN